MLQNLPKIPNTGEQFQKAIIQTIKVVLRAPRTSPLSEVDVNNLAKFMLQLCRAYENVTRIIILMGKLLYIVFTGILPSFLFGRFRFRCNEEGQT